MVADVPRRRRPVWVRSRHLADGSEDLLVAGAPAEHSREFSGKIHTVKGRVVAKQLIGRQQERRGTESALQGVMSAECLLQVQAARRTESLPANGAAAGGLLELSRPDLDFAAVAAGMGVPAVSVRTAEEFAGQLRKALAEPGPHLIEAVRDPPR